MHATNETTAPKYAQVDEKSASSGRIMDHRGASNFASFIKKKATLPRYRYGEGSARPKA